MEIGQRNVLRKRYHPVTGIDVLVGQDYLQLGGFAGFQNPSDTQMQCLNSQRLIGFGMNEQFTGAEYVVQVTGLGLCKAPTEEHAVLAKRDTALFPDRDVGCVIEIPASDHQRFAQEGQNDTGWDGRHRFLQRLGSYGR